MGKIFISYRTADEPYGAALLDRALSDHFGSGVVFRASRSVPLGDDFDQTIMSAVREASVLLAVIGPNWLTAEGKDGRRRLDDPNDFVRREIAGAFKHGVRVVPILMNATRITNAQLPADIAQLAGCQDVRVHFRNSHFDLPALVQRLGELIPAGKPPPTRTDAKETVVLHAKTVGMAIANATAERDFVIKQNFGK